MMDGNTEFERLLRSGHFGEIVRRADIAKDLSTRLVLAHALVIVGDLQQAMAIARETLDRSTSPTIRCRAEATLGLATQVRGNLDGARVHFEAAIKWATDANDVAQIAWSNLHLFRLAVEQQPAEVASSLLSRTRRAVMRSGDSQLAAYLHATVAVLEGQAGRLTEALRHCDVADSLLALAPNAWIAGSVMLNRACLAFLTCEFEEAATWLDRSRKTAHVAGHSRGVTSADINLGHVQTIRGEAQRARQTFARVLESKQSSVLARLGALEGVARLALTSGDYGECETALRQLEAEASQHSSLLQVYPVRWGAITRARLLLHGGDPNAALRLLHRLDIAARSSGDLPLAAAIRLVTSQAAIAVGDALVASRSFIEADRLGIAGIRQLQPDYYETAGTLVSGDLLLRDVLLKRSARIRSSQLASRVLKDGRKASSVKNVPLPGGSTNAALISRIAAAFDLAFDPRLLATELCEIINILRCSDEVGIEESTLPGEVGSAPLFTVFLGELRTRNISLRCRLPQSAANAVTLADVLRIGRAAVALERARQEERSRAALWPPTPVEEQAGALFLAEEMQALLATARRIAPTTVPVLITGETGTGKEVLARMIHAYSPRAGRPFLPFNCTATPKEMLDSQLFGHRRGAFTGASDHFPGVIRAAAGGTLFLDEIGETTLDLQPKLLRFLESSEVHPIGETQPVRVDVRILAATNADLDALLAQGRFREDLFYRLNIVRLHVPPLRERRVEIPALAHHYLQKHGQECGKPDLRLAEETMEYLVLYRWPGNVRQLANEMRRLAALAEPGAVLMPEHLSDEIAASRRTIPASERTPDPTELVVRLDQPMAAAQQHLERAMLQYALRKSGGRIEETAALLGLSRKGLYLKRQRYGLERPEARAAEVA